MNIFHNKTKYPWIENGSKHPVYVSWDKMIRRCRDDWDTRYPYYGARGIAVCERWKVFKNFADDMLPSWSKGMTIERIDNDGNYCPENCRWATRKEQCYNNRRNRRLKLGEANLTLEEWSYLTGISRRTLYSRIVKFGWSIADALTTPPRKLCFHV